MLVIPCTHPCAYFCAFGGSDNTLGIQEDWSQLSTQMWKVEVRKSNIVKLPQGTKTSPNELLKEINKIGTSEYLDNKSTKRGLIDIVMQEKKEKDS